MQQPATEHTQNLPDTIDQQNNPPASKSLPGNLESALESARVNEVRNPYLMNEISQPVRVKSTGQGADYLLQSNKDLAVYRGDIFTEFSR